MAMSVRKTSYVHVHVQFQGEMVKMHDAVVFQFIQGKNNHKYNSDASTLHNTIYSVAIHSPLCISCEFVIHKTWVYMYMNITS